MLRRIGLTRVCLTSKKKLRKKKKILMNDVPYSINKVKIGIHQDFPIYILN